ncbi:hypothetical protein ABZP36_015959 [Zizania latifolia]
MADYCQGGRSMYSSTDDCYEAGRHGHGHGHGHGQGHGSMRVQSHTDDYYYDGEDRGRRAPAAYGDDCGYGGRTTAVYSEEYPRKEGYGGEQEYYKREEREHKNRERLGEVGALASGAFALYEGHRAKKDPANAQRHRIEQGVAAVAALGAGGYAYHEHHEQKEASYGAKEYARRPQPHLHG